MKKIVLLIGIFFSHQIAAVAPAWSIQPKVCIAEKIEDTCHMSLNVTISNLPSGEYCLVLNAQKLECFQDQQFKQIIPISITQPSILELQNTEQQNILSQNISIKYLQSQQKRRRVRDPWSLF